MIINITRFKSLSVNVLTTDKSIDSFCFGLGRQLLEDGLPSVLRYLLQSKNKFYTSVLLTILLSCVTFGLRAQNQTFELKLGTESQDILESNIFDIQSIDFDEVGPLEYGDDNVSLIATASSGLTVSFSSSNPDVATVSGNVLTIIGAGSVTITATQAGNDEYTAATVERIIVVNPKELTIDPDYYENYKFYGTPDPVLAYDVEGDLIGDDALTGSLSRESGENAGEYDINLGSLSGGTNYSLILDPDIFEILTRYISITIQSRTKVYGEADPELTYVVAGIEGGLAEGDVLSGELSRELGENVGEYAINLGTLSGGDNYVFAFVNATAILEIIEATLTATAEGKTKTYGFDNPSLTISYTGFMNGDDVTSITAPIASTEATTSSGVGDYDITLSEGSADNYTLANVEGMLTVSPAVLTVTAEDKTKTYGSDNPSLTVSYTGFVNGDDVTSITAPTASTVATTSSGAGDYAITLSGGSSANYTLANLAGTLTVNPKALTIDADENGKLYGTPDPVLAYDVEGDLIGDDALTGSLSREPGEDVGQYDINLGSLSGGANYSLDFSSNTFHVVPRGITIIPDQKSKVYGEVDPELTYTVGGFGLVEGDVLSGELSRVLGENVGEYGIRIGTLNGGSNYTITPMSGSAILEITEATLTAAADDKTKTYGSDNPSFTVSYIGFMNGDDATSITAPTASTVATTTSGTGDYAIVLEGGATSANYTLANVAGTLTVSPKSLTIDPEENGKFYGTPDPVLAYDVEGDLIGDDALTGSLSRESGENAGEYDINLGSLSGGTNYSLILYPDIFEILTRYISITPDSNSKTYGEADPELTYTLAGIEGGLAEGDALSGELSRESGENVGEYAIGLGTLSGGDNYVFTLVDEPVILRITEAILTATAKDKAKIYGADNPSLTVSYTGFVNGDDVTSITAPTVSTVATTSSGAGDYAITLSGGSADNYTLANVEGTLTVSPAVLTATAEDKAKTYGTDNPSLTVSYAGFVNGDDATSITAPTASTVATTSSGVDDYAITVSGGSANNYTLANVAGTLTVSPATLTAIAKDKAKIYGSDNPSLTVSYTGFVNGDDITSITAPTVSTVATTSSGVDDYAITLSGGSADNYTLANVEGTLTVSPAMLTATAEDKAKTYGTDNPSLTISYTGFVNGDDATSITAPTASTVATTSSGAGDYAITLSGGSADNYTLANVEGTLTVSPAVLTATAEDKAKTYGSDNPSLIISYTGFVNGDDATSITAPTASTVATTSSGAGDYAITLSGGSANNYTLANVSGTLTVSPAALTATAEDKTKTYGSDNPSLTVSYTGFVNGDDVTSITAPAASTVATTSSGAGDYAITLSDGSADNYTLTNVRGALTINKAPLIATASDFSRNKGESNPVLTILYTGFVNGEDEAVLEQQPTVSTIATESSDRGSYEIALFGGMDDNYQFNLVNGVLMVTGPIFALPSSLVFESTALGLTTTLALQIENSGDGRLVIEDINLPQGFSTSTNTLTIDPGASQELIVSFNPIEAKLYAGQVIINSNDGVSEFEVSGEGAVITAIEPAKILESEVKLSPNPATNYFSIDFSEALLSNIELRIANINGEAILSKSNINASVIQVDVGEYPQGLYLVHMKTDKGSIVKKIIIRR